ncbi:MAG: M56 family metallopeptidase, partial [Bacteroidota bacterium]
MIKTPMTFGIFQPKILLPNTSEDWSKEQMKIVLLHELAHIKRQDYLLHLLGLISLSLYWFHPLVWFLQKWQQEEREKACDEYVLKQGISKTNYAESLVNIARHMLSKKAYRWHSELPMAASSETKKRVLAILKFDLQQWQFTRWMQWRWIGFFACVLPLLAAIHPATRELMEESIPKIEAVLEQPVFVPKEEFVENKGVAVNNVKNVRVTNNDRGLKVLDTLAQLPLNTIQQMSAKNHLPKKITDIKIQGEKSLKHYSKWGGYDDRSESQDSIIDTDKIKAFYGKWEEDNHIIEIWIRGQYELQNSLPFFTNLSPKSLILIQKREKGEGKKCCEKLIIQQLKHNGRLGKKGYRDGIPIRAGENIYTYEGDNAKKTRYTITASQYGGFKFSGKKKDYRAALQTWKEMD